MSKSNVWKLILENIGGIKPRMELKIIPGLTVIKAPNAVGKSSIASALQLLTANELPKDKKDSFLRKVLNETSTRGEVIFSNGDRYSMILTRTPKGTISFRASDVPWESFKAFEACFCLPSSKLVGIINSDDKLGLADWFRNISDVGYYSILVEILNSIVDNKERDKRFLERELSQDPSLIESEIKDLEKQIKEKENESTEIEKKLDEMGYEEAVKKRREFEEKKKKLDGELSQVETEITRLMGEIVNKEDDLRDLDQDIETYSIDLSEKTGRLEELKAQKSSISQRLNEVRKRRNDFLALRGDVERKMKKMRGTHSSGVPSCEYCGSSIDSDALSSLITSYEQESNQYKNEIDSLKKESSNLAQMLDEISDKEKEIVNIQEDLERYKKERNRNKQEINRIQKDLDIKKQLKDQKLKDLNFIEKEMEKAVVPRTKEAEKLKKKLNILSGSRNELNKMKISKMKKLEELRVSDKKFAQLQRVLEKLKNFSEFINERYEYLMNGVRIDLNGHLSRAIDLLEFTSFQSVQILDDYSLRIIRNDGTVTDLEKLSTSEKLTIALLMMFVAKQAYSPDFPLFIVDEVMGAYDRTRFERMLDYIRDRVDYLIVTALTPLADQKDITIEQSL